MLGHEIGHVTARHAAQAYTRQAQASIGLTILSIFVPGTQPFADLSPPASACCSSRTAATPSSRPIGWASSTDRGAGWDPAGVPRFLSTLARVDALSERGVPNWLSTHPDPGIARRARREPVAAKFASAATRRRSIDDSISSASTASSFGDNPKDGIVRGNEFLHPLLRIGVEVPGGLGGDQLRRSR